MGRVKEAGQTLVALLAFMATAMIITTGATAVVISNTQSASKYSQGEEALQVAESGADNALMHLVRNPSYTGETLTVGSGSATITVSGSSPYTITSIGQVGEFVRTVQVTATRTNNILTVTAWSEVP
jgi:hypothetical protein